MIALPLDAADLDRLGKFLGMLGSDHMGERAAAALKADALVKNAGATWTGLIDALKRAPREPAQDQSHARRDYARDHGPHRPAHPLDWTNWRAWTVYCQAQPKRLTNWEADFLQSLRRFQRLSPKQFAILDKIVRKVGVGRWRDA